MESVTLNFEWQNGLPWMRQDTESLPSLLAYVQLRVKKPIEDEVRVEFAKNSVHFTNSLPSFGAGSARVQVNLVVDPVLHGWIKTLRLINCLLALIKR